jgi:hypothetical protein
MTWKGAISLTREAMPMGGSVERRRPGTPKKRYGNASGECADCVARHAGPGEETTMRSEIRDRRSRRPALVVLAMAIAGLTVAPIACANVYKCKDDGGGVIYQEEPCPAGRELRNFDTDPPDLSVIHGGAARAAAGTARSADTRATPSGKPAGKLGGDPKERKFIRAGMTESEVVARIGRPDATSGGKNQRAHWSYLPAEGDPDTVTSILFAGGVVSEVTRKVVRR